MLRSATTTTTFLVAALLALLPLAAALGSYSPKLPPTRRTVPRAGGGFSRALGHWATDNTTKPRRYPVNQFGADLSATFGDDPWNSVCLTCAGSTLCHHDSDGDGWSNGAELGDPCCEWRLGAPRARLASGLSHPGNATSVPNATMRALLKTIDCTAVPVYVNPNSTLPRFRDSRARAAAPVIIAVSAAATVLLLGFLLARTPIRRSGLAHFLRHTQIAPTLPATPPILNAPPIQLLDMLGVRDLPRAALLLTPDLAFVWAAVIATGVGLYFAHLHGLERRNLPHEAHGGLATGMVAEWFFALACLPVYRFSAFTAILGVSFERAIALHRAWSRIAVMLVAAHFIEMWKVGYSPFSHGKGSNMTMWGFVSFMVGLAILVTSVPFIRRKLFETFSLLHAPLAVGCLTFAAVHSPNFKYKLILPLVLWVVDLLMRRFRRRRGHVTTVNIVDAGEGGKIVELVVTLEGAKARPWAPPPACYAFVNIPAISSFLQWYPLSPCGPPPPPPGPTPTSPADHATLSLHIGGLSPLAVPASHLQPGDLILIEGPYGFPSVPVGDHEQVVVLAGGVGLLPMLSCAERLAENIHVKSVHFVTSLKSQELVDHYHPRFQSLLKTNHRVTCHTATVKEPTTRDGVLYQPGWPKADDILAEAAKAANNKTVGVYTAGPAPMVDGVVKATKKVKGSFALHTEHMFL